jgi:hypothetical protein
MEFSHLYIVQRSIFLFVLPLNALAYCELRVAQLVRFFVVEPVHQSLSLRLGAGAHIFFDLFRDLTNFILSLVGDVPVDSEVQMVTLSVSMICGLSPSEVLIEVGLRACVHRSEYACVYVNVYIFVV